MRPDDRDSPLSDAEAEELADLVREAMDSNPEDDAASRSCRVNDAHGKSFGRFEDLIPVGRGGTASVYRAFDPKHGRFVALKIPHRKVVVDSAMLRRFQVEAEAVAKLDHPSVVPLFEVGEVDGLPYIASAFCDGLNLSQIRKRLAKNGRMVEPLAAARIALAVARALSVAHRADVVHRDVKPSNIILQPSGEAADCEIEGEHFRVRVIDFGLAKLLNAEDDLTQTDFHIGTPPYMAPEQFSRRFGTISPGTDVYGLGATLYTLLAGREPFSGVDRADLFAQILTETPPPLRKVRPSVPKALAAICRRCLEKSPADRYPSMNELADDLERFLAGRRVKASACWPVRALTGSRRSRTLTATAVLMIVTAAVGLGARQVFGVIEERKRLAAEALERDYLMAVQNAFENLDSGNVKDVRAFRDRFQESTHLHDIEWRLLAGRSDGSLWAVQTDSKEVHSTAISPNPKAPGVYCGLSDGRIQFRSLKDGALLRELREGHTKSVNCLEFLDFGKTLVTCGDDGLVCVWTGGDMPARSFKAHDGWISTGRATPDGRFFITGGDDAKIKVWRLPAFELDATLERHKGCVRDVSVSDDGRYLISCGEDKKEFLWRFDERRWSAELPHCTGNFANDKYARNIHFLGGGPPYRAAALFFHGQVVVYRFDGPNGVVVERERNYAKARRSVASRRDGRLFLTLGHGAVVSVDPLSSDDDQTIVGVGHEAEPFAISYDSGAALVATGDRSGQLRIWSLEKDRLGWLRQGHLAGFIDENHVYISGRQGRTSVHRASDGKFIHGVADPTEADEKKIEVEFPIVRIGSEVWSRWGGDWRGLPGAPGQPLETSTAIPFEPEKMHGGRLVCVRRGDQLRGLSVFSPGLAREVARLGEFATPLREGHASEDGQWVGCLFAREAKLFRLAAEPIEIPLEDPKTNSPTKGLSFSPDGEYVTVTSERAVNVWSTQSGKKVATLHARDVDMSSAVTLSGGRRAIGIDWSGRLFIWNVPRGLLLGTISPGRVVRGADFELSPTGTHLLLKFHWRPEARINYFRMIDLAGSDDLVVPK